jgi:2-succinyl-6-hydroxy-2,4-cyclohexadiene-1-carboxylate synthase
MPARSDGDGRLVFLHGFTQTHHHWHPCAHLVAHDLDRKLGSEPTLAFVDLPGHGLSADERLPIADSGDALADLIGPGTVIGYSMGARFALHAVLSPRSRIDRLVLIGGTAGIDDPGERADRHVADEARADRVERIGVAAFLDEWLAAPLFATLPADARGLAHRRRNSAPGLAASLRDAGTGAMSPLWTALQRIEIPVLVLAGELDTKFTALGRRMTDLLPQATFAAVPGAGHAAHTERPTTTATTITTWLDKRGRAVNLR